MSIKRKRIVVVYDKGAAGPGEIYAGLHDLADLAFVIPDTTHTRSVRAMLAEFGAVIQARDVVRQLQRVAPDGIVTFSERMLPLASEIASELGLPFHSPQTTRLLTDKYAQRQRLTERNVDPTRSFLIGDARRWREALDHVGVPAVIKPLRGEGSRNTHRLNSPRAAYEVIRELLEAERGAGARRPLLVVEEFLQGRDSGAHGDYVSVESVVSRGEVHHAAITGKLPLIPPFRESGQFWPSHLSADEQRDVLTLTTAALHALDVRGGVTHTEIKLTDRGPRIIEINGRLGGWISELTTRTTHLDLIKAAGRMALNEHVTCDLFDSDRTFFQYYNLAPVQGGRLEAVTGVRDLRAVPGVTGYRRLVRPGTTLEAGVTTRQLDAILGEVDTRKDMPAVIDSALATLEFQFTGPDGATIRVNGVDLARNDPCHGHDLRPEHLAPYGPKPTRTPCPQP